MNIFDSYTTKLRSALAQDRILKSMDEGFRTFSAIPVQEKPVLKALGSVRADNQPEASLLTLQQVISGHNPVDAQVGRHPDFRHLIGTDRTEWHYITSVFIDIKGSTRLHDRYELETVHIITNTIQSVAIQVCLLFGGHIQRLQGDGVFVYFGGKMVTKDEAVRQAATASAMFTYFVKNDLQRLFEEDGVENISTRIGIDFGDDHEVLWGNCGTLGCVELTTVSLHTSLASKCQGHARTNGIVIGEHVKDRLMIEERFFDCIRDEEGKILYVYTGSRKKIYYKQFEFNWLAYLKSLPYIQCDREGNLYVISTEDQERERQEGLMRTASLIQNGTAYTTVTGNITSQPTSVKNQEHRFHYEQPVPKK